MLNHSVIRLLSVCTLAMPSASGLLLDSHSFTFFRFMQHCTARIFVAVQNAFAILPIDVRFVSFNSDGCSENKSEKLQMEDHL